MYDARYLILTVKPGGDLIALSDCFSVTIYLENHQHWRKMYLFKISVHSFKNLLSSVIQLRLGKQFIFQQGNNPKHILIIIWQGFKYIKIRIMKVLFQLPDLNQTELLWHELKIAVHKSNTLDVFGTILDRRMIKNKS